MAALLVQTLQELLFPDNYTTEQAKTEVKRMLRDTGCIPLLWQVLTTSSQSEVRQHAAVLLRRKVLKTRQWNSVSAEIRNQIRKNILQVLVNEPDKSVGKSLAMLVATVGKHELPSNRWPELFQFLDLCLQNNDAVHIEIGMYVLSALSACASEQLKPHMGPLLALCSKALDDPQNRAIVHNAIMTLIFAIPSIETEYFEPYQDLILKVMTGMKHFTSTDAELAVEFLAMLNELTMHEVTISSPFVKQIIDFALEVASSREVDATVRTRALSLVCTIATQKQEAIVKQNLVPSILRAVFPILRDASPEVDAGEEEVVAKTPSLEAVLQVIGIMGLNLPKEMFYSDLMKHVDKALQSQEPLTRRAAYHAIGAASEGCADCMKTKHLKRLMECVYDGMNDPYADVRGAAIFALYHFSDYLQPDISKFFGELLPRLFDYLGKTSHDSDLRRKNITRMRYVVRKACENLGKEIVPYLPQIMPFIMNEVRSAPLEAKLLAINAIEAAADAAMEDLLPYFQDITELLKSFLAPAQDEQLDELRTKSVDAIGMLVCILGEDVCPIAADCVNLGINMMNSAKDPDLRQATYGLFAAVSTLLKQNMPEHLGVIVGCLMDNLQSTEGIKANCEDSEVEHALCDDLNVDKEEIDISDANVIDESDVSSVEVSNSYSQEKDDALSAQEEPAKNTGHEHSEKQFKEVWEMMEDQLFEVRKGADEVAGLLCVETYMVTEDSLPANSAQILSTMLDQTVPKLMRMIKEDEVREVVAVVFQTLNSLLQHFKKNTLSLIGGIKPLIQIIKDDFQGKLKCQGEEGEESEDGSREESDNLLIASAGNLLPTLAELIGGEEFAPFFAGLLSDLIKKARPPSSAIEKSFFIGVLAETVHKMGALKPCFARVLYNVFMDAIVDENAEVRRNAVYGLGVYASYGGIAVLPQYTEIVNRLLKIFLREKDLAVIDNICAALCRMITSNADNVPLDQVLPTMVQHLPLQVDTDEHITVINCLRMLYAKRHPAITSVLPRLIKVFSQMLRSEISAEVRAKIVEWVQDISNSQDVLRAILSSKPGNIELCIVS